MKDGVCPKCGSHEVYAGNEIFFKGSNNSIPINFMNSAALDNYVCVNCGYVESYISDSGKLRKIKENWPKVSEQKKKRDE